MNFNDGDSLDLQLSELNQMADSLLGRLGKTCADLRLPVMGDEVPVCLKSIIEKNGGPSGDLIGAFHELVLAGKEIDGRIEFCREVEEGHFWTYEIGDPNPRVWLHWQYDNIVPDKEYSRLAEFLAQLLIFEFIAGASFRCGKMNASQSELNLILSSSVVLPLKAWRYPSYPASFYSIGQGFAFVYPVSEDVFYFSWGAEEPGLAELFGGCSKWDWQE